MVIIVDLLKFNGKPMNAEFITINGRCAIIHEKSNRWYLTLVGWWGKKLNKQSFKTDSNGLVREPGNLNHCSEPRTWNSRDSVIEFLERIINDYNETVFRESKKG